MTKVARAYQVKRATVYRWATRYRQQGGVTGLERRPVSGRPRLWSTLNNRTLLSMVSKPASRYGYETDWGTCGRRGQVRQQKYQLHPSRWTVWRWLRDSDLTYQKPERRSWEAKETVRQEWLNTELPKICQTVKKYRALLYFQDESNISLTAPLGRTWSPRGQTPTQTVTGKRGGISAMSALRKKGDLIFTLPETRIASEPIIHFLGQRLKHHPHRHLVVVMDQAPPHTSPKTRRFIDSQPRLHVFSLLSYSPDWNPDEYVWNHVKHQELKGPQAKSKAERKALAKRKLKKRANPPPQMRGIFFRRFVAELLH